jgi:uncharacterized protein YdbL (DUF1318 family)
MKRKVTLLAVFAAALTLILACITVNIYFPEATVKKAADEIVDEVRKKEAKDKGQPEVIKEERSGPRQVAFSLVPSAFAQEETSVSTPTIRAIKDSLKQRFSSLKPFYDGGNLGENNKGMVDVRDESGLDLRNKATLRNLVRDENADRVKLYAEVAKALNIQANQIARVQKIFAASWIANASSGWWIQNDSGEWARK